jgi:hypothetical protein
VPLRGLLGDLCEQAHVPRDLCSSRLGNVLIDEARAGRRVTATSHDFPVRRSSMSDKRQTRGAKVVKVLVGQTDLVAGLLPRRAYAMVLEWLSAGQREERCRWQHRAEARRCSRRALRRLWGQAHGPNARGFGLCLHYARASLHHLALDSQPPRFEVEVATAKPKQLPQPEVCPERDIDPIRIETSVASMSAMICAGLKTGRSGAVRRARTSDPAGIGQDQLVAHGCVENGA